MESKKKKKDANRIIMSEAHLITDKEMDTLDTMRICEWRHVQVDGAVRRTELDCIANEICESEFEEGHVAADGCGGGRVKIGCEINALVGDNVFVRGGDVGDQFLDIHMHEKHF